MKTTMNLDALGTQIANAMMLAAAEYCRKQGRALSDADIDGLCAALRARSGRVTAAILDQGKALIDAGRGAWLSTLVATEAATAGIDAAKEVLA